MDVHTQAVVGAVGSDLMGLRTALFTAAVMGISLPVSRPRMRLNTDTSDRLCGWTPPPVLSHTQHIVALHCKPPGARPDVTALPFSPLLCAAARAGLLNVTFLKAPPAPLFF